MIESWEDAEHYLQKFDEKLGDAGKHFEGVLLGQTSLWYHAQNEGTTIEERPTDDLDVIPNGESFMAVMDVLDGQLSLGGYRAELEDQYLDILSSHPNAEAMLNEENHYDTISYDNLDLHVIDRDVFIEDKSGLKETKHAEDIEKMKSIYNESS